MSAITQQFEKSLERGQGFAARSIDRMPKLLQNALVKALKYPYVYPQLDPLVKVIVAVQFKQGAVGLIGTNAEASRQQFERLMQSLQHKFTHVEHVQELRLTLQSGEISARHYHPAPNKKLPMLVFYHGGGFVVGSVNTHDEVCRLIAVHANVQVISVEYPLAPATSPAQLIQSCEDALAWVYQNRNRFKIYKSRIALGGDSAGGCISAVLAQRTVNKSHAPSAQFLIYPVVDFKSRHPSFYAYQQGLILTAKDVDYFTDYYATQHGVALDDPLISPTYGNLTKIAPSFIITAGHDVLHDEAKIYAYKLRQSGTKVCYTDYEEQTHGFVNLTAVSKNAKKYLIEMSKAFRRFWDKSR